jgi:catechol 2,3-dioxygenase-like lactoylglutathione lyase family enzyme
MDVARIVPNVTSSDRHASARFLVDLLGLEVVMDDHGVVTVASPSNHSAQINFIDPAEPMAGDVKPFDGIPSSLAPPHLSIEVADVEAAHRHAVETGVEICYSLRTEKWGVRRFWVLAPDGLVVNVLSHVGR